MQNHKKKKKKSGFKARRAASTWSAVRSMAMVRRWFKKMGMTAVVLAPGGSPSTWGTVRGLKEMRVGWKFKVCSWDWAFLGSMNVILWLLSTSLLERWRNGVIWPKANHGNMTTWNFGVLAMALSFHCNLAWAMAGEWRRCNLEVWHSCGIIICVDRPAHQVSLFASEVYWPMTENIQTNSTNIFWVYIYYSLPFPWTH